MLSLTFLNQNELEIVSLSEVNRYTSIRFYTLERDAQTTA